MKLKLALLMGTTTLSQRLTSALKRAEISPVALAKKAGTSEATISNWLNDKVQVDHVKAVLVLRIANALKVRPEWLLLDQGAMDGNVTEAAGASHPVKPETLTISLQLVAEALDEKSLTLPPAKRAELTALVYDLVEEGMPQAKVLRFARAAAA
jgi:transcriptional regulator with XRE-family HTH domain